MELEMIHDARQLAGLVNKLGFLPFFRCGIPGFSLQECTPPGRWFTEGVEGPWEWREQLAMEGEIAYGKLFCKKAGFISMEWYPVFANARRDGYDFDARYEDGMATRKCKRLMELVEQYGSVLTGDLKRLGGFGKGGETGFETAITTLQMQTYLTVQEFEYKRDKQGKAYGWGTARYTMPERLFGAALVRSRYGGEPKHSRQQLLAHMQKLFPDAPPKAVAKLVG